MTSFFKTMSASTAFLVASAVAASAQERSSWLGGFLGNIFDRVTGGNHAPAHNVPEIDASSGLLAGAAVLASLVLAWEIRRRRRG
ncbi:VPEID-CTERM sorting domain-containing protein [Roseovarius sp. D0-M9]|uniref:VPEID-CTERM sorting domain-containing protein n=1 Tax=Roseovarius sp. D0-M9 TaxID=3127117 RepID=UPI00300FB062